MTTTPNHLIKYAVLITITGLAFGWLMAATDCRPLLPVVKLILSLGELT